MISSKLICILVVVCFNFLAECAEKNSIQKSIILDQEISSSIQKALSSLPEDKIPNAFKINLDNRDNSNWCCKISLPIINDAQTRIVSFNIVNSGPHRCGYTSCGFLGWSSCTNWCTSYWHETKYTVEHYTVTRQDSCPDQYISCCANFFLIHNHCFHLEEIQGNLELLAALQNQGIVIPPIDAVYRITA